MEKVRVGIVGFGQIGPVHLRSYQQFPEKAEVAAVVDLLDEKLALAKKAGAERVMKDYEEMLAMDDVDAVSICIPTYLHRELAERAAAAGKHVFCEKPMAMTAADASAIETACAEAGVKLQLGFVRRFDNEWLKFRDIVQSKTLGDKVVWRSAAASQGAPTPWFFQRELGGGPFMDGAVHNYDFGHYMFGPVKQVTAHGTMLQPERTVMDTGTAVIEYVSGDVLQMMWSWGLQAGSTGSAAHDVLGREGALLFTGVGKDPLDEAAADTGHLTINRPGGGQEPHSYAKNDMFRDELESFIDCIREDKPPLVTAEHGKEALKVALAILESAETGRTVPLT